MYNTKILQKVLFLALKTAISLKLPYFVKKLLINKYNA